MTIKLHAQPYNLDAEGFFFRSYEEYLQKTAGLTDSFGQPVEEFEVQMTEAEDIDIELFRALGGTQSDLEQFFRYVDGWDDHQKTLAVIMYHEGYQWDWGCDEPDDDIVVHYDMDLRDLAEELVDDGVFGEVPDSLRAYLDYDRIARDLQHDYTEAVIAGTRVVYRTA